MINQNKQEKESDSDLDAIEHSKEGPMNQLPRATMAFELPMRVSTEYYQHVPSLANTFSKIAGNTPV